MQKIKIHIRVTPEHLEVLDGLAKSENRSRSNMADMLMGEALQARQDRANNRIKELRHEIEQSKPLTEYPKGGQYSDSPEFVHDSDKFKEVKIPINAIKPEASKKVH